MILNNKVKDLKIKTGQTNQIQTFSFFLRKPVAVSSATILIERFLGPLIFEDITIPGDTIHSAEIILILPRIPRLPAGWHALTNRVRRVVKHEAARLGGALHDALVLHLFPGVFAF